MRSRVERVGCQPSAIVPVCGEYRLGSCRMGRGQPRIEQARLSGVVEVSVYVALRVRGRGIGSKLLAALVEASESNGLWTLQAGIFPQNTASIQLHRRAGFRIVGTREKIG